MPSSQFANGRLEGDILDNAGACVWDHSRSQFWPTRGHCTVQAMLELKGEALQGHPSLAGNPPVLAHKRA